MEYVDGSNLQQYLEANGGRLEEDVARFIFQQLMIAVDFCHKNGKVNRDIKLANVLLQVRMLPHAPMHMYAHMLIMHSRMPSTLHARSSTATSCPW